MPLLKCDECGNDVSMLAAVCPNCGAPVSLRARPPSPPAPPPAPVIAPQVVLPPQPTVDHERPVTPPAAPAPSTNPAESVGKVIQGVVTLVFLVWAGVQYHSCKSETAKPSAKEEHAEPARHVVEPRYFLLRETLACPTEGAIERVSQLSAAGIPREDLLRQVLSFGCRAMTPGGAEVRVVQHTFSTIEFFHQGASWWTMRELLRKQD